MPKQTTVQRLCEANDGKVPSYAWPGGYTLLYLTKDGGTLCPECVNKNLELCSDRNDAQWFVTAYDVYYEGPTLHCDNCNAEIESSYGDPNVEDEDAAV